MRQFIRTILIVSLTSAFARCAPPNIAGDSVSSNLTRAYRHRTFVGTIGTVLGQVAIGTMGGMVGATFANAHPVAGGVGWIMGSSFGVYAIGDATTGRGNYWWTAIAGTAGVIPFVPGMTQGGLGAAFAAGAAMLTSLIAEIVVFYITEAPAPETFSYDINRPSIVLSLSSLRLTDATSRNVVQPCFVVQVVF